MQGSTIKQVWIYLWEVGYEHQSEGEWLGAHPGKRLVGRAVTAHFLPRRTDLDAVMADTANSEDRPTGSNNPVENDYVAWRSTAM